MTYIFGISFIIIGTLIGAGFISGAEIKLFFYSFGKYGYLGLFISSILFGIVIFLTLNRKEKSYHELLENSFNNVYFRKVFNFIIMFFLLFSFFIMVAGFSSFLYETAGINTILGSIILSLLSFFILKSGKNGLSKLNTLLVPFLLIIILLCFIFNNSNSIVYKFNLSGFFTSSILYTSYNLIILIPILLEIKNDFSSKKENFIISIFSSSIMLACGFIILSLISKNTDSLLFTIPLLGIINTQNIFFSYIIKLGILIAILTSAISSEFAFVRDFSKVHPQYVKCLFFVSLTSIFVSQIGFQNLIEVLYPLFGIIGIINLFIIF